MNAGRVPEDKKKVAVHEAPHIPPKTFTFIAYPPTVSLTPKGEEPPWAVFSGFAVNVPVAVPPEIVQVRGEFFTTPAGVLVMVHGPVASEGKPFTVTLTCVFVNPKACWPATDPAALRVMNGSMISVAVPLSGPQKTVSVYAPPPVLAGPVPMVKAP